MKLRYCIKTSPKTYMPFHSFKKAVEWANKNIKTYDFIMKVEQIRGGIFTVGELHLYK